MYRLWLNRITNLIASLLFTVMSLFWLLALAGAVFQDEEQLDFLVSFLGLSPTSEYSLNLITSNISLPITEVINNGNFVDGLNNWQYRGEAHFKIAGENQYLQLGTSTSSNLVSENCISQTIDLTETVIFLSFAYQLFSNELDPLFDVASLVVLLDGQPVLIIPTDNLITTWQDEIIRLQNLTPGEHQLRICAGNSGDRTASTWVYLDNITTQALALTTAHSVRLTLPPGFTARVDYTAETAEEISVLTNQLLSFNQPLVNNLLTVKLINSTTQESLLFPVKLFFVDDTPHSISALQLLSCDVSNCLLSFSIDQFRSSDHFITKASAEPLTTTNWDSAQTLNTTQLFAEMELWQPVCFNNSCSLVVILPASPVNYLGLKVCNVVENCLVLSSATNFADFNQEKIIINEMMFNPVGNDRGDWAEGEWLELYNTGLLPVDVNQWTITDAAANTRELSNLNCDTNHDFVDSGETIVPAQGYLVIYLHGSPILNNTGDIVTLKNNRDQIIDGITYPGSSVENKTYARIPNASETWQPRTPPSPLVPNSL